MSAAECGPCTSASCIRFPAWNEARPGNIGRESARRFAADGPNLSPGAAPKTAWVIVLGVLRVPMFLMLLAAGGIYLLLGNKGEALFLLGFVFVVIGITLAQERETQRALESLRDLSRRAHWSSAAAASSASPGAMW